LEELEPDARPLQASLPENHQSDYFQSLDVEQDPSGQNPGLRMELVNSIQQTPEMYNSHLNVCIAHYRKILESGINSIHPAPADKCPARNDVTVFKARMSCNFYPILFDSGYVKTER